VEALGVVVTERVPVSASYILTQLPTAPSPRELCFFEPSL